MIPLGNIGKVPVSYIIDTESRSKEEIDAIIQVTLYSSSHQYSTINPLHRLKELKNRLPLLLLLLLLLPPQLLILGVGQLLLNKIHLPRLLPSYLKFPPVVIIGFGKFSVTKLNLTMPSLPNPAQLL